MQARESKSSGVMLLRLGKKGVSVIEVDPSRRTHIPLSSLRRPSTRSHTQGESRDWEALSQLMLFGYT